MRYARLFEAEFSEDVGVFLPAHLVETAVQTGVTMRPPESGRKYVAAVVFFPCSRAASSRCSRSAAPWSPASR